MIELDQLYCRCAQIMKIQTVVQAFNMYLRLVIVIVHIWTTIVTTVESTSVHFNVIPLSLAKYAYIGTRGRNFTIPDLESEEPFVTKADICMAIMRSEWMHTMYHLNAVNLRRQDIYEELQQDYPSLFAVSYTKYDRASRNVTLANPYRLRTVTVYEEEGEKSQLQEYAFSCIAKNRRTGEVEEYFISPEYKPSELRFVFKHNSKRELVPVVQASPVGGTLNFFDKAGNVTSKDQILNTFLKDTERMRNESEERRRSLFASLPDPKDILFGASTWPRERTDR